MFWIMVLLIANLLDKTQPSSRDISDRCLQMLADPITGQDVGAVFTVVIIMSFIIIGSGDNSSLRRTPPPEEEAE